MLIHVLVLMQICTILIKSNLQALFLNQFTRENKNVFFSCCWSTLMQTVRNLIVLEIHLYICVWTVAMKMWVTANQLSCATTLFAIYRRKTGCDDYFSWPHINHTRFNIALIQQNLIREEKYSWQRGSHKSCKYFMHANKSWCTVFYFLQHSWIIWVQNNRLTVYFAARS